VNVVVTILGDIEIDDVRDRTDVDATADHVGGDEDLQFALAELLQHAVAIALRHVAVHAAGPRKVMGQLPFQLVGSPAGATEHDRLLGLFTLQQADEQFQFAIGIDGEITLFDRFDRHRVGAAVDDERMVHVRLREPTYRRWQGRGEQQRLPIL